MYEESKVDLDNMYFLKILQSSLVHLNMHLLNAQTEKKNMYYLKKEDFDMLFTK